ncbi:hypothetical protein ABBQ38_004070 [Trebouxia sp. C0009 RCD-2024]
MAETNEYDMQREERIRRNKAMLATLKVQEIAEDVAAPMLAAQQQKEAAKETKRKKYVATGPARQSRRAGAERTRAKLQQQAQKSAESSDDEQSISSASQESQSVDDSASKSGLSRLPQKRKRSTQEADFDPADMASSDSDAEVSEMSDDGAQQSDEDAADPELQHALAMSMAGQTGPTFGSRHGKSKQKPEPRITQASAADDSKVAAAKPPAPVKKSKVQKATRKPGKGKSAGRVGLINPTPEEIKTAFSMFNPHNKSVISAQDIARVALEHGVNFDEDELNAMMEVAASITQRASTSNMTFQGFQKLIESLSTVT